MRHFLAFLQLFALSCAFSFPALAGQVTVTRDAPLKTAYQLQTATTVVIENSAGNISVAEVDGSVMTISGEYRGQKPLNVNFGEIEPGKFKLMVEYPDRGIGHGSISVENGSINITRISTRGSIVISGDSDVIINGQRITGGQRSAISVGDEGLHLRIGIPKTMLAHLKLDSESGDLSVKGPFHSADESTRKVFLQTVSGTVACDSLCALGELTVASTSGDVIVQVVRTTSGMIKSVSGDIQLRDVNGNLDVKATSGDVQSEKGAGDIRIHSVSGDVRVRDRSQGVVSTHTTSGDIRYSNPSPSVREEARSVSGDIIGMKKCTEAMSAKKPGNSDPFKF